MTQYYRPIVMTDPARPAAALALAGGGCWFDRVEVLRRGAPAEVVAAADLPDDALERLSAPRLPVVGVSLERPRLMAVINTTPDSFSDGGRYLDTEKAVAHAREMARAGAEILDIGGESTRPGADEVSSAEEIRRTAPVIAALRAAGLKVPVSIDTRKAIVARAAFEAGAQMLNDVSAFGHDPEMAGLAARTGAPVCLMHAQGAPKTMQADPRYDDVLLDVYDFLAEKIAAAEAAGVARTSIIVDPGIGFGKTLAHNLALLRRLSLFHGLGCAVLLGVSRKRFIGAIGVEPRAERRAPGSIAVGLAALAQGVQILRVHDMAETRQAVSLWQALTDGNWHGET